MKKGIALALATAIALMIPATTALAGNNDVIERGSCSGSSDWKLKLSEEDGRIEVEYEVDQNVSGDEWKVKIKHDGVRVFRGTRTTGGASGSFEVRIVEDDHSGTDAFKARAKNLSTGELCVGTASW